MLICRKIIFWIWRCNRWICFSEPCVWCWSNTGIAATEKYWLVSIWNFKYDSYLMKVQSKILFSTFFELWESSNALICDDRRWSWNWDRTGWKTGRLLLGIKFWKCFEIKYFFFLFQNYNKLLVCILGQNQPRVPEVRPLNFFKSKFYLEPL